MKKTLVLGASLKPERYSNMAIRLLRKYNFSVVAVGGREGEVADVRVLKDTPYFNDIHTITIYMNCQRQKPFYDYILSLKPQRVIFNPGAENPDLKQILLQKNIEVIENCTLVMLRGGMF